MFVFNYQQNLTQVTFDCIICCNIPLDPVFKDKKLRWQLLIPISLIQTLDSEYPVKLQAVSNTLITKKKVQPSISSINFAGEQDFKNFVIKVAK